MRNKLVYMGIAGLAAATIGMSTPASAAQVRPAAVVRTGSCSAGSTWKLTLKKDAGRIEADNEIQTTVAGQSWRMRYSDNGTLFATVTKSTVADGSVSATRFATNAPGTDKITVRSTNQATGEICVATASF